jgi:hypothetical protein
MRVVCNKVTNADGEVESDSSWLTVGREYLVLSISAIPRGAVRFQIMSDDGVYPVWFDSGDFTTSDRSIPSSWVVDVANDGSLEICPKSWSTPGFWEAFLDGDAVAGKLFDDELALMAQVADNINSQDANPL